MAGKRLNLHKSVFPIKKLLSGPESSFSGIFRQKLWMVVAGEDEEDGCPAAGRTDKPQLAVVPIDRFQPFIDI